MDGGKPAAVLSFCKIFGVVGAVSGKHLRAGFDFQASSFFNPLRFQILALKLVPHFSSFFVSQFSWIRFLAAFVVPATRAWRNFYYCVLRRLLPIFPSLCNLAYGVSSKSLTSHLPFSIVPLCMMSEVWCIQGRSIVSGTQSTVRPPWKPL